MFDLKGWRTLGFSLMTVVLGFLQQYDWVSVFSEKYAGLALIAVGVINAALRFITTSPVGKKV